MGLGCGSMMEMSGRFHPQPTLKHKNSFGLKSNSSRTTQSSFQSFGEPASVFTATQTAAQVGEPARGPEFWGEWGLQAFAEGPLHTSLPSQIGRLHTALSCAPHVPLTA